MLILLDAEHFYVLEDWIIDKSKGNGVTGWVGGCHGYQRQVIQGLEALVKYPPSCPISPPLSYSSNDDRSFGSNYDSGRRIVGKVRGGVVGECKKEFETTIFATLETSIKLAKGTVESPARDFQVEQVTPPQSSLSVKGYGKLTCRTYDCCCVLVIWPN